MGLFDNGDAWNPQPTSGSVGEPQPEPAVEPESEPAAQPEPGEGKADGRRKRRTASHKARLTAGQFAQAAAALARADEESTMTALRAVTGKDDRVANAYALYTGDAARAASLPLEAKRAGGEADRMAVLLTAAARDRSRLKALKTLLPALDATIPDPPSGDNDIAVAGWAAKALGSMDLSALETLS